MEEENSSCKRRFNAERACQEHFCDSAHPSSLQRTRQVPAGLAALAAGKGAEEDDSSSEGSFKAEAPSPDARPPSTATAVAAAAAAAPMSPILGGADALGALTRDLDDRLRADAWRPAKGPSPWQVSPFLGFRA